MKDRHIDRLEAQLEQLIEGAFKVFGRRLSARDLALSLARSMEDNLQPGTDHDPRRIAPDHFQIYLHPDIKSRLLQNHPNLHIILRQHLTDLAADSGYQLVTSPAVELIDTPELTMHHVRVKAQHSNPKASSTGLMQVVPSPDEPTISKNPQLIIGGDRSVSLANQVVNIGRSPDNDVIIDDMHVSRHHLQLRQRFGSYTLFDINSRGGTFVNNVEVREHRLQSGDVIRIGSTQIIYVEDDSAQPGTTQAMEPVDL